MRTYAIIITVLFLLSCILCYFVWDTARDKELGNMAAESVRIAEAKIRQAEADSVEARQIDFRDSTAIAFKNLDALYSEATKQRSGDLKALRLLRISLGVRPDTVTIQIEANFSDQQKADSTKIRRLEERLFSDSSSFEKSLAAERTKYLEQVVISDLYEGVAAQVPKLKEQKKILTWVVVLETALIILSLLL